MQSNQGYLPTNQEESESINPQNYSRIDNRSQPQLTNVNILHVKYFLAALCFVLVVLFGMLVTDAGKNALAALLLPQLKQEETIKKKQQSSSEDRQIRISSLNDKQQSFFLIRKEYQSRKELVSELSQEQQQDVLNELSNAKYELETAKLNLGLQDEELQVMENGRNDKPLSLPNILWIFLSKPLEEQNYLNQLTVANNRKRASAYKLTCHLITVQNHGFFLSSSLSAEVKGTLQHIRSLGLNEEVTIQLSKFVLMTAVLEQHGGVFIDEQVSLLQDFDWIKQINNNILVNRGNKHIQGKVVGFHSVEYGSPLERQKKEEMFKVKQYSHSFPAIEHFFLAAQAKTDFIAQLRKELQSNLKKKEQQLKYIISSLHQNYKIKLYEDIWLHMLMISAQKVLIKKQLLLQEGQFAIDWYGLKTINKDYFACKLETVFTKYQYQKTYSQLARLSLSELEAEIGPMRYVAILIPRDWLDTELRKAKQSDNKYYIVNGSFLQLCLFPNADQPFIVPNPEKPTQVTNAPEWSTLPKLIWLFWDDGISKSHATNQLAKRNIQLFASISGFKVIEVNKTNLRQYISKDYLQRIDEALFFNNRGATFKQTYSDLVRLALLAKHGGVYMDVSYVLLQGLDWLVKIASYPSQFVFNRYGLVPEVFMFFNPHYGGSFDQWQVDPIHNTKAHWHLSYENNFIAAEPGNKLIIEWFDSLLNYLTQPYSQTEDQFRECNIMDHKWSSAGDTYLMAMDALKCVIGRRQKQLTSNNNNLVLSPASQYYRIWSINGYNGVQKFRGFTNFQDRSSDDNLFFRRYSSHYISSVIGRPRDLIKLYSQTNQGLNRFLLQSLQPNIFAQIHHRSYFNKFLFSFRSTNETFIANSGNLIIKETS